MIHLTVNNRPVSVPDGTTILDAAKKLGINIPTLCYLNLHDINYVNETASCRVCMVEMKGPAEQVHQIAPTSDPY